MKKRILIVLGVILIFVLVGFIVIRVNNEGNQSFLDLNNDKEKDLKESEIPLINNTVPIEKVPLEKYITENLEYSSSFISYTITQDILESETKSIITKISYSDNKLDITLQRVQICNEKQELLGQNAKYYSENGVYFLNFSYQEEKEGYDKECIVKARYQISNQIDLDTAKLVIINSYEDTDEELSFCKNELSVYANEEVFINKDDCLTCTCKDGVLNCEETKGCKKEKDLVEESNEAEKDDKNQESENIE